MRILVYEYICGGGLAGQALPDDLAAQGWAMLASVVEDLSAIRGLEVVASVDARLDRPLAAHQVRPIASPHEERRLLTDAAQNCDGVLLIAPEFDGILYDRCCWIEQAGGRLLGPSSGAVALAADKFALNRHLARCRVPVPEARLVNPAAGLPQDFPYPAVLKPRYGAGSENIFLLESDRTPPADALDFAETRAAWVLERYVPGQAASATFLIGLGGCFSLLPGIQQLSDDGRFRYLGGQLPLPSPAKEAAIEAARRAAEAVPGLQGYVGVDLVLQHKANNAPPSATVIEINPRLTTSYVGLRRLARGNLAGWMLDVIAGRIPLIEWKPGSVSFSADGQWQQAG